MTDANIEKAIDDIIIALNLMNTEMDSLKKSIRDKLSELDFGVAESKEEITALLNGIVDLLTSVTQKEYRVNDLILAITEVVASHKLKRNEAGDMGDGKVLKV